MSEPKKPSAEFIASLETYQAAAASSDVAAMESAAIQVMAQVCEQAAKEPSENLRLVLEAHEHEAAGDWLKAEAAFRQALDLARKEGNAGIIFMGHSNLGGLFNLLGHAERALEEATAATEAARRADMPVLLARALTTEGRYRLNLFGPAAGLVAANEILSILGDDKLAYIGRANGLVLRARCYAAIPEPVAVREDLERAWALLMPKAGATFFAGVQGGLAGWWEVTAALHSLDADHEAVANAWSKVVGYRRLISHLPQLEGPYKFAALVKSLDALGHALLVVKDTAGAEEAFKESREIRRQVRLP
jgi:tetratricopeptide (TPR) repeat protein